MRKRIAVFGGGWAGDYIQEVLAGIIEVAEKGNVDVFAFINFSVHSDIPQANVAEINLFTLPDIVDFDGVILLANSFNNRSEMEYLTVETVAAGVPTLAVEYQVPNMPLVSTDNYSGMYDLAEHMFKEHQVKQFLFIGGPEEHSECKERVAALRAAAKANCLPVPKDCIVYADWSKSMVPRIIDTWVDQYGKYPQAIMCANDIMALATCAYLESKGLAVPEDVMVTGYDCIRLGREHNPSIASVNHEWFSMGTLAGENMLKMMDGEDIPPVSMTKTRMACGGTCGCDVHKGMQNSKQLGRALTLNKMDPIDADSHFRHFYSCIRKAKNRAEIHHSYSYMFGNEHAIEGNDFKMYVDPQFFEDATPDASNLMERGHRESYDVLVNLQGGVTKPLSRRSRYDALFRTSIDSDRCGFYVFLPLYTETKTIGFAMLTGAMNVATENQYYIWSRHMNQSLEIVRNNLLREQLWDQLMRQSVTDPLTKVYNRSGCEKNIYPMLIDWTRVGGTSVVMLVDIDRMKNINDKYGHLCGDKALLLAVSTMRKTLPEGFMISRFGGDEFFIGGMLIDAESDMEGVIARVEANLRREAQLKGYEFPVSLSMGYTKVSPETVLDIERATTEADKDMYRRKREHHLLMDAEDEG